MTDPQGDGLVRPLNAPAGGQLYPGVQPGVTGPVVLARLVVVSGAGGEILVYNGTPGPGTLVGSWAAAAGTDQYGNIVQKDLAVYAGVNSGFINVSSTGAAAGNTGILFTPASTTHVTEQPQISGQSVNAGAANEYEILQVTSGIAGTGAQSADMTFASTSADSSIQALIYQTIAGTRVTQLSLAQLSVRVPISCTSGSVANQTLITTDTFHPITLDPNWSTLAGQPVPSYQLTADGMVHLTGAIQFNVNIANTNVNGNNPLPAAYRPLTGIFIAGAEGSAGVEILPSGVIVAGSAGLATTFCNFNGRYPLNL